MHEVCVCFSCCITFTSPPAGMLAFPYLTMWHAFAATAALPTPWVSWGRGVQVDMQNAPAAATQRLLTPCKSHRSGRMQECGVTHARLHRQLNLCRHPCRSNSKDSSHLPCLACSANPTSPILPTAPNNTLSCWFGVGTRQLSGSCSAHCHIMDTTISPYIPSPNVSQHAPQPDMLHDALPPSVQ